jgi:hypothetical protein
LLKASNYSYEPSEGLKRSEDLNKNVSIILSL